MIKKLNGDLCHEILSQNAERKLAFDKSADYEEWRKRVREKFKELFGINCIAANVCPLNVEIEEIKEYDGYKQIRFTFESERGAVMPCYLLIPKDGKESHPVTIALQGHITGFHNSIGVAKYEDDAAKYFPRYHMGLQAVENGFAALCMEQRGMGENGSPRTYGKEVRFIPGRQTCAFISLTAFNLGRTVLGERVWDVSRAIDALKELQELEGYGLNLDQIMITGHSGGATASYYAACYDERIKYCVPSCGFCSYKAAIMDIEHCACNYVPGICEWFEMEDLACMIAPRKLTIFAGMRDPIFPFSGVSESFETIKKIYEIAGAADQCGLVGTPKDHYWCHDLAWERIVQDTAGLGWKQG